MEDFLKNILRYPRFFVSSLVGLVLVILTPFKNLLKLKQFRLLIPALIIGIFLTLLFILKAMVGL